MNNANPFLPQGSLLEQKNKKRARVKVGVISVLVFNILVISPLLIQGCSNKSKTQDDTSNPMLAATNDVPAPDTNTIPALPVPGSNVATTQPPVSNPPPVAMPQPLPQPVQPVASSTQEYVIIKGDTYSTISKKYGVTVKAIEAANPDVPPSKMKVGKAIHIPAPTTPAVTTTANVLSSSSDAGDLYVVKSGDTLGKIAKAHGVSTTALRAANALKTDKIKVGDKLKVPAKTTPATPTAPPPSAPDITPLPPVAAPTPGH